MRFEKVLITTDFSEAAKRAVDFAATELMEESEVHLLSVATDWVVPPVLHEYIPDPQQVEKFRADIKTQVQNKLQELVKVKFKSKNVKAVSLLSDKPVAQEIVDYAKANAFDLIIMSTHGRGAIGTMFLGSVVSKVIKLTPCPVLVIPPK